MAKVEPFTLYPTPEGYALRWRRRSSKIVLKLRAADKERATREAAMLLTEALQAVRAAIDPPTV